ncbi:MAG TPA: DUF2723 domain-containing protein [Bacteroidota bacterium]|nr:DUF2723 domain-containing protein [Bacteroidota bacterium]
MNNRLLYRVVGFVVFLLSLVQFLSTVQPSVSFWDPGELSAAAYMLQVPHPPGGPLFLLVGRFFYLLPFPGNLGLRMNLVSTFSAAFSVLFLYLVAVRLIRLYRGGVFRDMMDEVSTIVAAGIGALALSVCDTFWFSGVEANYFSASTLLYSAMVWLMLVWDENADKPGSGRYLLMIAFLAGLSPGVHLMSVVAVMPVVMMVTYRWINADEREYRKSLYVFVGHVAMIVVIALFMWNAQTSSTAPDADATHAYDVQFIWIMLGVSVAYVALFRKHVFTRNSIYAPLVAGGIGFALVYPGVVKELPAFLRLVADDNAEIGLVIVVLIIALLGLLAWWAAKNLRRTLHYAALSVLLAILGFSIYAMIIIRANHHPPMNENSPGTFSALLTYLNREQYGDFPMFKRRWNGDGLHDPTFKNYSSDLDFFVRYQMNHMYHRYLLFNFLGRTSDDQDAPADISGYFGIPLLMALFGVYWHFKNDWKRATIFLILFFLMGHMIAYYQNQQDPQPRERDYFYGGAYFVVALWIAVGLKGIFDLVREHVPRAVTPAFVGAAVLGFLFIPGRMFQVNYPTHDRSNNWVPWDLAYNMLQTCEKDAILFTYGDNDTFPLWYLQDVEGVRRDVRVVNLSLGNTPWYIQQMKDKPYYADAKAVPISFSDKRIAGLGGLEPWRARTIDLPVPPEVYARYGVTDTAVINKGKISFVMRPPLQFGQTGAVRTQDLLVLDVVQSTKWTRPIYFASTCDPDARISIDEYLWFEGMAWKLEPIKTSNANMGTNAAKLDSELFNEPQGFSKTPAVGYKFRGLPDKKVFLDENARRMVQNYRSSFLQLAMYYGNVGNNTERGVAVLDRMMKLMPIEKYSIQFEMVAQVAFLYHHFGKMDEFNQYAQQVEQTARARIQAGRLDMNSMYNPYSILLQLYEMEKDNTKTLSLLHELEAIYPNDPGLKQRIQQVEAQMQAPDSIAGAKH